MTTFSKGTIGAVAAGVAFVLGLGIGIPLRCGDESTGATSEAAASNEATVWTCSMHPQIQLPEAGACPICGMDLIPLADDGGEGGPETGTLKLSERARALAEIETIMVRRAEADAELRLLGRLGYDETTMRTITPWTDGRIDRLLVSAEGERIKRGQMIALLYSPEVYAAQVDLLSAKSQIETLKNALPVAKKAAQSGLEASRNRLRLLGVNPTDLETMEGNPSASRHVGVTAHYDGTIVEQLVHEGAYVKAGTPIFRTADLGTLWAQLDAYENDLASIGVGQRVSLVIATYPGEIFEGRVAFIDPIVDPAKRTAEVRVEIDNDDGRLGPGMFADAIIHANEADPSSERPLVIPESAVLFTGRRSIVYVEVPDTDDPTYQLRVVRLGPRTAGTYPVLEGLEEGERVVVQGAFVIDADLQIRGGMSMMSLDDDLDRESRKPVRVNATFMAGFHRVTEAYLAVAEALSKDDADAAKEALHQLADHAAGFSPNTPEEARRVYLELGPKVAAEARRAAALDDIAVLRSRFETISELMIAAVNRFGHEDDQPLRVAYCPMAFDNHGARWLQRAPEIENPYFGEQMYRCGSIEQEVDAWTDRERGHEGHDH